MSQVEQDRQAIFDAKKKGGLATFLTFSRLSGPGWLQGAITLGGGSLGGSLYLGMIAGYDLLWLQPLMRPGVRSPVKIRSVLPLPARA